MGSYRLRTIVAFESIRVKSLIWSIIMNCVRDALNRFQLILIIWNNNNKIRQSKGIMIANK